MSTRKRKYEEIDWSDSGGSEPEEVITEENSIKISDRRCPYCIQVFKTSLDLTKHEKNCKIAKTCNAKRVTCKDGSKKFICHICCRTYKYLNIIQNHEKKHEPPGGFFCKYCNFQCCLDVKLEKHKEEAHKEFLCRLCNITFETRETYIEHIKIKHDGRDKEYKICEDCGRQFRYSEHLNYHKKTNCQTIFPFKCNECGKSFRSKGILKTHSLIHSGEKKFFCSFCPMSFICKAQVVVHERKHTGEKPYKCDICSKAFAHRESLVTHSSTHTGMKPYLCECCNARFSCVSSILAHRRTRPNNCGLPEYCTKLAKACPRPSVRAKPNIELLNIKPVRVIRTSEKEKLLEKRKIEKKSGENSKTIKFKRKTDIVDPEAISNNTNFDIELNKEIKFQLLVESNKVSIFTNKRPKKSKNKGNQYSEENKEEIENTYQPDPLLNESNLVNHIPEIEGNNSEIKSQLLPEQNKISISARERTKRSNMKIINYADYNKKGINITHKYSSTTKQTPKSKNHGFNIKNQHLVEATKASIFTTKRPNSRKIKIVNLSEEINAEIKKTLQPILLIGENNLLIKNCSDEQQQSKVEENVSEISEIENKISISARKRNNYGSVEEQIKEIEKCNSKIKVEIDINNVTNHLNTEEKEIEIETDSFFEEIKTETFLEYCEQNKFVVKKNETCNSISDKNLESDQDSERFIDSSTKKFTTSDSEDEPLIRSTNKIVNKNINNKCKKLKQKREEIFECMECIHKQPFRRKISYEKHLRNRHKKTDNEIFEILSLKNHKPSSYSCKICGKSFTYSKPLNQHIKLHGIDGKLIIKCKTCLKYFATKEDLLAHAEKNHKNQITCLICNKMYPDRGALQAHKRYAHTERVKNNISTKKKDTYICNKCGKILSSNNSLISHELSKCSTEYLYKCDECGKSLSSPSVLKTHMMIHTGELPFLCPHCSKGFRTKAPMIVHQRMHTGEKPFQCTYCDKTFAYRESLFIHLSTHTGIKRFMCTSCSERFSCISGLTKHWRTHSDTCGADPNRTTKSVGEFVGYRKGQLENKKKTI